MKRKIVWLVGTCLVIMSLILVSCGGEEEVTEEEPVTEVETPVEGVPQYGGTYTYSATSGVANWDPYIHGTGLNKLWYETLAMPNWMGVSHELVDFKTRFTPNWAFTGMLAESWKTEDYQTITFHIRKGVYFHDIPPVNGRELTAYDVEYSQQRILGLGSGFTEPSPYISTVNYNLIESITAIDKYTVVYELSEPSMMQLHHIFEDKFNQAIIAREAVELWGDVDKFEYQIGTGPFIAQDFVTDTSLVTVRHSKYWGYDERFPENRLPYLDSVKVLIIPDQSTAFSALRTGKIDRITRVSWENADSLKKTNPELVDIPYPGMGKAIAVHIDVPPFDDIRVRRAMQMSIDLETLADTYYGGYTTGTPIGLIAIPGYRADYEDWPQEVKDGYAYNPEGAKELLAEAGYPGGFKCTFTCDGRDTDLWQIVQAYFAEVGIDMEIEVYEPTTYRSYIRAEKAVMSPTSCWMPIDAPGAISRRSSTIETSVEQTHINDPFIDDIALRIRLSLDEEEQMAMAQEADMYVITQQWTINLLPTDAFSIVLQQPYIKGLPNVQDVSIGQKYARCWIDQDMKKALGY